MPTKTKTPTIRVQHSLSDDQAKELYYLVAYHVNCQVDLSWVGGGDPLDTPVIRAKAKLAMARLEAFINRLVRDGK